MPYVCGGDRMVVKHTGKNGLRIVLEKVPFVRSVSIGIWILTGSRNESAENNGISHFLEHMLFKGTKKRNAQDIAEAFDSIGGQVNAFTAKEYTCYYAKVLDHHKEYALEILSDMFFNSIFDEEELEREKNVVLEEIKMAEDTPDDIIHDLLEKTSFANHPLGNPILGKEDTVQAFHREKLQEYMKNHYIPENMVISIAGNVDESFIQTVEDAFNHFQETGTSMKVRAPHFSAGKIERNKDTEQAHICLGYRGLALEDESIYSLIMLNNLLGGSMSSRLFQEIREKRGLAYSVFSYPSTYIDSGLLTIYAGTSKDQLTLLENTIRDTIEQLIKNGITDKELINNKEQLKGNLLLSLESSSSIMSRNGKNELLLRRERPIDELVQAIDMVTKESIQFVIEKTFKQSASRALIFPN